MNEPEVKVLMLKGEKGDSAYQVAEKNGYTGSEKEWADSFLSADYYFNKSEIETKLRTKPHIFSTVADLKKYDLKVGEYAETTGYYAPNDGGFGLYEIVDDSTPEDTGLIHNLANGLKAKLINTGIVNVKKYGAKGDGVTDDTVAFTEAYSVAKANATTVFVPAGRYAVNFDESNKPDNLRFWGYGQINNHGIPFQISTNRNLGNVDLQNPFSVSRKTFGRYNSAAAASIIANSATGTAEVMGINDESMGLENYDNRDSVGLYVSNETNGLIITADTVGFGVNYVDVNHKTDLTNVEVGMFVDTSEKPKKTGIIKGITGNRITVNKWIAVGNGADGQIPATGSSVIINPLTAIWGQNTLVSLNADQTNVQAIGYELDIQNDQPHRDNVNGYMAIMMGNYSGNAAYTAKSVGEGPWRYGLYSNGSEIGLRHEGGAVGADVSDAKYTGFSVSDTPISFKSSGQENDLLIHSTDDNNNVLFQIKKSGELSKLRLARALTSGASTAPVIFANGDITLPDPLNSTNEIKLIVNTTSANVQITAPINYEGRVLQAIAIKPHKSMAFVCDADTYFLLEFDGAIG